MSDGFHYRGSFALKILRKSYQSLSKFCRAIPKSAENQINYHQRWWFEIGHLESATLGEVLVGETETYKNKNSLIERKSSVGVLRFASSLQGKPRPA